MASDDHNSGPWIATALLALVGGFWAFLKSIRPRSGTDEAGRKPTDFYMRIWDRMEGKHEEALREIREIRDQLNRIEEKLNRKG